MSKTDELLRDISEHSSDQTASSLQDLNDSIDALRDKINTQLITQLKVYPDVLKDTQDLCERLQVLNNDIDSSAEEMLKREKRQFESIYASYENRILEFNNLQLMVRALELLQRLTSSQEKCKAAVEKEDVPSTISLYLESVVYVSRLSDFNLLETNMVMKATDDLDVVRKWTEDHLKADASKLFTVDALTIEIEKPSASSGKTMENIERMNLSAVVARCLEENLFKPLLNDLFSNTEVAISGSRQTDKIVLSFSKQTSSVVNLDRKLENVCSVFQLLTKSFLGTRIIPRDSESTSETFLKFMYSELSLGRTIVDKIYSNILKEFLPTSVLELTNYKKDAITKCEQMLFQLGLSDVINCFVNFRENLTCYFAANFVSSVLCKSRELISGDSQKTCVVGCESVLASEKEYHQLPTLDQKYKSFLSTQVLSCPSITVSEHIRDFVDMLIASVQEASQVKDLSAASEMFQCCEDVFYLFCDLVSTFNPNQEKLCFMKGVHFNNLMFVSHCCMFLGLIPACYPDGALGKCVSSEKLSFVHFSSLLRVKAEEMLSSFLQHEKLVLTSFFVDQNPIFAASHVSLASSAVAQTVSPHEVLKPLEKCMFYIETRFNSWKPPVLSKNSCTLAIASLLNFVLHYVVNYCINFEDITTSDVESLEKVLRLAQDKCASLVSQISRHCQSGKEMPSLYDSTVPEYHRLRWIKKLLGLGLIEIHSQWNSPSSELKAYIFPDELKNLIRALFQNTELRSQILSSIQ